jgi:hypothetical protein
MTQDTPRVPHALLFAVQTVLVGAWERLAAVGWRRFGPTVGAAGGDRLVDALNYASVQTRVDQAEHMLAFTCAAMAIELHTSRPAHALLPDVVADEYLSPDTTTWRLHLLDASIIVRYNTDWCVDYEDARALLRLAYEQSERVIAAQLVGAR